MKNALEGLKKEFNKAIKSLDELDPTGGLKKLSELKVRFTGRKSEFSAILKKLGSLPLAERPEAGQPANQIKKEIEEEISSRVTALKKKLTATGLSSEEIDVTLPGRPRSPGTLHPLTIVEREITETFKCLGFDVADGPELEDDFHNFEALNIPKVHPARDMQDTLYISEGLLLRSHTSNTQIREMERIKPPIRIICPGRVYRADYDATHTPMFTQVEGLLVDKKVSFADLRGTLDFFVKKMYGKSVNYRFRGSYFPFTEPSAEVDIQCIFCRGSGCGVCKKTGWLEILGCGMVNPEVFKAVKYKADEFTGYAFGMGVERIAMLKFGISDIRSLFENDGRLLKQF